MSTTRSSVAVASATLFAGVFAVSGVAVPPVAHASPLDGIRSAVVAARSGAPCPPLNYSIALEGEAQARLNNTLPGVPPPGQYKGRVVIPANHGDPTQQAIDRLIRDSISPIRDCAFKDFGVGMSRSNETSKVAVALGEPAVAEAATPVPEQKTIRCTGGLIIAAGQTCPAPEKKTPAETAPINAVTLDIRREGLRAKVTVGNTSNLQAQCTYSATEVNGLGFPVSRDFSVNPKGSTALEFAAPLIGQTYTVVVTCRADFNGQNVEIGRAQQDFSTF